MSTSVKIAEIGFVFDNACLYSTADTVQQIAAPKAASSPIHCFTQISELFKKKIPPKAIKYLTGTSVYER